jgi:S-methylmethionine-dependent homocysteine/selenocysteine methylase
MARHRTDLPQLGSDLFLTDGGLETTLVFHDGLDLPCFAAYPLLGDAAGRARLDRYMAPYVARAVAAGTGFVLETPTWRANREWGARLGHSSERLADFNRAAVAAFVELRDRVRAERPHYDQPMVISGQIGPRGDGYDPGEVHDPAEFEAYHREQIHTFAGTEADLVSAFTITSVEEAVGLVRAAQSEDMPIALSFTVETDGRLPSGAVLADAIEAVDAATGDGAAYFMINCAHPTHFADVLHPGKAWTRRIRGLRANASTRSHAELDESTDLDAGDPADLAERYAGLRAAFPQLTVLGGCCGTDHRHVEAIADRVVAQEAARR